MTHAFTAPTSLAELSDALGQPLTACLIAGGTDLLIAPGHLPASGLIVDLGRLDALRRLECDGDTLMIGAGVTVARLASDPLVRRLAPALADAADQFASVQIRNRATIGGNIANASAAADLAPALVAMAAEADLLGADGVKSRTVEDMLATACAVAPGSAIVAFRMKVPAPHGYGAFVKLGRRQEPTISRLTLAACGPRGGLRLVAGALGPAPRRLWLAERALNGGAGFVDALVAEVAAAIPGRASASYKARAIRALGSDLVARLGLTAEATA